MATQANMIHYMSTVRGMYPGEAVYYGTVTRIPKDVYFSAQQEQATEAELAEALAWIETAAGPGWERVQSAPIERYEVYDKDTGDVLIMWRVAGKERELASKQGN